jgi:Nucleoside diphosphate kinase
MRLCGIIKPHALKHSKEILEVLRDASLIILEIKPILYTNTLVEILYDHMSSEARSIIAQKLVGHQGRAILLCAVSIEQLLEIAGTESDPSLCTSDSIRARFGVHALPAKVGCEPWWDNAFHRPINMREAIRDLLCVWNIRTCSKF